jgi:hypothetical protein
LSSTFSVKQLRVTFVLQPGNSFSNGSNTVVITGLRMKTTINTLQYPAFPQSDIYVYGMLQADMNTLIDFEDHPLAVTKNSMTVEANIGTGWTTVFAGQIASAQPIYQSAPDVPLKVIARVLYYESIASATPTSYTGATDIVQVVSGIALRIGAAFENDGVSGVSLHNPYIPGTLGDQLIAACQQVNIDLFYDYGSLGKTGLPTQPPATIIIAPKGMQRSTPIVNLTPQTGLVGYPTFDSQGYILARSFYNPGLKFGGKVTISGSDLPRANGTWGIRQLTHLLDAVQPDGNWFSDMYLMPIALLPYPTAAVPPTKMT